MEQKSGTDRGDQMSSYIWRVMSAIVMDLFVSLSAISGMDKNILLYSLTAMEPFDIEGRKTCTPGMRDD